MKNLIEYHIAQGTDALVAVGTTGESATLDEDEHCDVIKAIVDYAEVKSLLLQERAQTLPLKL